MKRSWIILFACLAVAACIGAAARKPVVKDVQIKDLKFVPAIVTINVGDSVRWTNKDSVDHKVKAADGSFTSPTLKNGGDPYEWTFRKAGTYDYGCELSPRMKGRVVVNQ